jgi:CheY-like chemotaxis protein/two-component sensor histidine kinase
VSRISRGKVELRKERLSLAAVLESALETMRPTLDASGRELVVDLPAEPVFLEADFTRLAQVFANLLHNAVKYSEPGGQLRLQAWREGASIVVRVKDDGVGIPAESLPRVFDMFTQVDRSTGASRGGLGVGLSIVRNLVTMHGGTVEALSEGPGRGAEFVVRLPVLSASAPASNPPESATPTRPAPRRRILVVDDNQDSADCLALLLEMKGNDVRTAHDGREALGAAEAFRPDVIFLDLGMPGLDGHAVCRQLRTQAWGRALPIVALTGWSQEEDRRQSQESGFTHHLVKPAEPAVLERLLADLPSPPPVVRPST